MTRQFEEHQTAEWVVAVPAVVRLHALITVFVDAVAFEPVVFDVVDDLEEEPAKQSCDEPSHADLPSQGYPNRREQPPLQDLQAKEEVGGVPRGEAFAAHVFGLDLPSGIPRHKHGTEPKHLQPLVAARRPRILLGGDIPVMPLVVLNEEVRVERRGQQGLRQQVVVFFRPVPQFVGDVDAEDAAREAHGQHKPPPLKRPHLPCSACEFHEEPCKEAVLDEHHGPEEGVVGFVFLDDFQLSLREVRF